MLLLRQFVSQRLRKVLQPAKFAAWKSVHQSRQRLLLHRVPTRLPPCLQSKIFIAAGSGSAKIHDRANRISEW